MQENKPTNIGYASRACAYALIGAAAAGLIYHQSSQNDQLKQALGRSDASIAQIAAGYKKLDEEVGSLCTTGANTNMRLTQYISQSAKEKSGLEAKIKMTNEELARLTQDRYDSITAQENKAAEYDTSSIKFEQNSYYPDDKKNSVHTEVVTVTLRQLFPDKKDYLAMTKEEIEKKEEEYIGQNKTKDIPRPTPPPSPNPKAVAQDLTKTITKALTFRIL